MGHSESMSDTHKRLMDYVTQNGMAPFRVCPLCNGKGVTLNRVLEGWAKTDGVWRLVAFQSTPIPA